jgi:hypothetical protein
MSDQDFEQQDAPSGSMMDRLREQHRKLAEQHTTELEIPGYSGELVARYRILDVQNELKKITLRVNREFKDMAEQALYSTIDALILACEGLFYYDGSKLRPLSESFGPSTPPVKYDHRLVEFLALELGEEASARDVVFAAFGGNEPAIITHGQILSRWMSGMAEGVMSSFMEGM